MFMGKKFQKLVQVIKEFQVKEEIFNESELESNLSYFLKSRGYSIKQQGILDSGVRTDICVGFNDGKKICLELKVVAGMGCMKQLDKYLGYFPAGIMLVCWKASENVRNTIDKVKHDIKIPVELIELRKHQSMI